MRAAGRARLALAGGQWLPGQGLLRRRKKGPHPSDRAEAGTKQSPLGAEIEGANSCTLLQPTIASIVGERPDPAQYQQHLCLDKADRPTSRAVVEAAGSIPHLRRIGEEQLDQAASLRHRARRSLVQRTLAWLQQCRASLIRYDRQPGNSLSLIQLACTLLWYGRLHRARQVQAF